MSIYSHTKNNNVLNTLQSLDDQSPLANARKNTKIKFLPSKQDQYGSLGTPVIFSAGSGFGVDTTLTFPAPTSENGTMAVGTPVFGLSKESINLVNGGQGHKVGDLFSVVSLKAFGLIRVSSVDPNGSVTDFSVVNAGINFDNSETYIVYGDRSLADDPLNNGPSTPAVFEFVPDKFSIMNIKLSNRGSGYKIFTNTTLDTYLITANGSGQNFFAFCNVGTLLQFNTDFEPSKKIKIQDSRHRSGSILPENFNSFGRSIVNDDEDIFLYQDAQIEDTPTPQHYIFNNNSQKWESIIDTSYSVLSGSSSEETQCDTINSQDGFITVIASIDPLLTLFSAGAIIGGSATSLDILTMNKAAKGYRNIVVKVAQELDTLDSAVAALKASYTNLNDPLQANAFSATRQELVDKCNQNIKKIFTSGLPNLDCKVREAILRLNPNNQEFLHYLWKKVSPFSTPSKKFTTLPLPNTPEWKQQRLEIYHRERLWKALDRTQAEIEIYIETLGQQKALNEFDFTGCNKPKPKVQKKAWLRFKTPCATVKPPTKGGVPDFGFLKDQNVFKPKKGPGGGITGLIITGGMIALDYWCSEVATAEEIELVSPALAVLDGIGGLLELGDPCVCQTIGASSEIGYEEAQLRHNFQRLLQFYLLSDTDNDEEFFLSAFGSMDPNKFGSDEMFGIRSALTDLGVSEPFTPENVLNQLKPLKEQLNNDIAEEKAKYILYLQYKARKIEELRLCLDPNDPSLSDSNLSYDCPDEVCSDTSRPGSNILLEIPIQDLIDSGITPPKRNSSIRCY